MIPPRHHSPGAVVPVWVKGDGASGGHYEREPNRPGLLLEWRRRPESRTGPKWEGLVVVAVQRTGSWALELRWVSEWKLARMWPESRST